jgi:hypothetical protein
MSTLKKEKLNVPKAVDKESKKENILYLVEKNCARKFEAIIVYSSFRPLKVKFPLFSCR